MIENSIIYAILGIAVGIALVGMAYFYLEHNAKNELKFKDNPLKLKWVVGSILGGLFAGGMMVWYLSYVPEIPLEQVLAQYGTLTGIFALIMSKVGCEGISGAIKYFAQKKKEVEQVTAEEGIDWKKEFLETKEELAKVQSMLGIKKD